MSHSATFLLALGLVLLHSSSFTLDKNRFYKDRSREEPTPKFESWKWRDSKEEVD